MRKSILVRAALCFGCFFGCSNDDARNDVGFGQDADPRDATSEDASTSSDLGPAQDASPAPDLGPMPDSGLHLDAGSEPHPSMSFFVTSVGNGANAGNYGGLAGADARCQQLAGVVGLGTKTWRAYLSAANQGTVIAHAKDRIGNGPWFNFDGDQVAANVAGLHATPITYTQMLTERGTTVPTNEHDILTGTDEDGEAWTSFPGNPAAPPPNCANWTSSSSNDYTYVGHADWDDPNTAGNRHWIASHETSCDPAGLASTAGSGRLYCFAID